jgi:hypothetical protein
MKLALTVVAALALAAAPAQGATSEAAVAKAPLTSSVADPQALAFAREFVELLFEGYLRAMRDDAFAEVDREEDVNKRTMLRGDMERYLVQATPVVERHLPRIRDAYVRAYALEFRADELRQIIAFARTPAGRHFVDSVDFFDDDVGVGEAMEAMMQDLAPMYEDFYKAQCQRAAKARLAADEIGAKCSRA